MGKGISISVASDTRQFMQGVQKGIIEPLEEIDEGLEQLANDRSLDKLEDGFKDSQRESNELRGDIKKLNDSLQDAGRKGGRDLGDGIKKGAREGGEAVEDFKQEAKQNFGETVSSFRGDMAQIPDMIQGTLGGLAPALGPAGIIGAGILAAGVGVATSWAQSWAEKQEEIRQGFADAYKSAAEDGRAFLAEAEIAAAAAEIIFDKDKFADAKKDAETLGVSVQTIIRAQSGDQESLNAVIDRTRQLYQETAAAAQQSTDQGNGVFNITAVTAGMAETLRDKYEGILGVQGEMQEAAELYLRTGALTQEQEAKINRLVQARIDGINAAGDKTIKVTIDDADAQRRLDALTRRQYEINIGVRYPNGKPVLQ